MIRFEVNVLLNNVLTWFSGSSQMYRPHHFYANLPPWPLSESSSVARPPSHASWIHANSLYGNKTQQAPAPHCAGPVSMYSPSGATSAFGPLDTVHASDTDNAFASTSPTRENNLSDVAKAAANLSKTSESEFSPNSSKLYPSSSSPSKHLSPGLQSSPPSAMVAPTSFGSTSSHHLPSYPYVTGSGYAGNSLFHPADMFKTSTLSKASKKRAANGEFDAWTASSFVGIMFYVANGDMIV